MAHFLDIPGTKLIKTGMTLLMVGSDKPCSQEIICRLPWIKSSPWTAENIIVEPELIARLGREDIALADPEGRGYLGTLNVYHQLHCIVSLHLHHAMLRLIFFFFFFGSQKRLWQYTYPEVYRKNQTAAQAEADRLHKGTSKLSTKHLSLISRQSTALTSFASPSCASPTLA